MKNKFLLLVAALVLSTTATFASNQTSLPNADVTAPANGSKTDIVEQIRAYMNSYDIDVVYVCPQQGTTNYYAKDTYGIWYIIYVNEAGLIGGHSQVDY